MDKIFREIDEFFVQPNPVRSVFILVIALLVASFLSRYLSKLIIKFAKLIASIADNTNDELKAVRLRRLETYLSVSVALVRVLVVVIIGIFAWQILSPTAKNNTAITAIGASAVFIVLAGATINPLLRDFTSGAAMIAERWYGVGDHVRLEPFLDVAGVVERVTLRSTRIRRLNGEIVWVHNQYIQGVHVTPKGVRIITVDVLIRDLEKGMKLINRTVETLPVSKTTITKPLKVGTPEAWGTHTWRVPITGKTPPGREWLLEDYLITALIERDERVYKKNVLVHKPIARYTDPDAERNFKRAVRAD